MVGVTRVQVVSTRGANRMPGSGYVWFTDDRSYGWLRLPDGSIRFLSHRKRAHGGTEGFSFSSPPLDAYLENRNNIDCRPIGARIGKERR